MHSLAIRLKSCSTLDHVSGECLTLQATNLKQLLLQQVFFAGFCFDLSNLSDGNATLATLQMKNPVKANSFHTLFSAIRFCHKNVR